MGGSRRDGGARLVGIEGLRAIAATSILVYHVYVYGAPDGQPVDMGPFAKAFDNLRAGVTLFFVLSGFLLYRVFVSAALRDRPMPSVPNYFRNRALRIVPAYVAVLLAVALVFEYELLTRPLQLGANLLFLQNYIPAYIGTSPDAAGIAPAWSIVIEVSFYLVLPVLGYIAIRLAPRHGVAAALVPVALMVAAGVAGNGLARLLDDGSDALWILQHSLPTHADWFAAGMAVAVAQVLYEDGRLRLPSWWRPAAVAAAVALALGGMKLFYEGILNGLTYQTPIAFSFALLLAVIVLAEPGSAPVRVLASRAFVFAGLVSYSVFLIHDPLVRGFRDWGLTMNGRVGFVVNLLVIGALTFALATLTYRCVEKPALARKRRWQAGDSAGLGSSAPPGGDGSLAPGAPVPVHATVDDVIVRSAGGRRDGPLDSTRRLGAGFIAALSQPSPDPPHQDNSNTRGRTT